MCRPMTCNRCGRPSWAGCGAHVEHVLGHVPHDQRCQCDDAAGGGGAASAGGLMARLFGR